MADFRYLNVEPNQAIKGDCVVRAISLAAQLPYELVKRKLWLVGELYDCDCLCRFCYEHYIEDVLGCRKMNCEDLTVGEFADKHPFGTYLIRVENHLTTIIDSTNYDLWDTREELCDICWRVV